MSKENHVRAMATSALSSSSATWELSSSLYCPRRIRRFGACPYSCRSARKSGKWGILSDESAQGLVENLIVTVLFLTAVIFTIIQISLITINALIANEAAFASCRAAVVASSRRDVDEIVEVAAFALLAPHFSIDNFIPINASVWRKTPLGVKNKDHQDNYIYTYNINVKHATKLMFAGVLQPLLGELDPFIITDGRAGSFYSRWAIPFTLPTNARARMVKSPDKDFLLKAYPGAKEW
ncbi:MAG: hypothetical protein QME32_06965 [Endomicrobiia bacterium]|nr:hypothetical protein [Endomicrobiia bacterium]